MGLQRIGGGQRIAAPQAGRTLDLSYARPDQPWFRRRLIRLVERLSGKTRLERLYTAWQAEPPDPAEPVFSAAVRKLGLAAALDPGALAAVPREGPALVLANHPFGIVDGLLVGDLVSRVRRDVKLMTHSLLCQPEAARDVLLPVDFGDSDAARRTSLQTRKLAGAWLDAGHVLIVFPAGSVSTAVTPFARDAVDAAWHPFIVRLAARPGVRVVVMFLHGRNSRLFQIASHLSYPLRVALILRETVRRAQSTVRVSVQAVERVPAGHDRAAVAAALRRLCYGLAGPGGPDPARVFEWPRYIRW